MVDGEDVEQCPPVGGTRSRVSGRPAVASPLVTVVRPGGFTHLSPDCGRIRGTDGASPMEMVMCLSCGEFVPAEKHANQWTPIPDGCPDCGAERFKHRQSGSIVRSDE